MFKKLLMLSLAAWLLNIGIAAADPASSDWNDSWGFPTPAEKANTLAQAIEMEFVENGGFNHNETNFWGTMNNCMTENTACGDGDVIAIGNQTVIQGDDNEVNASNDGNVGAQNNNGSGSIDQAVKKFTDID